MVGITTITCMDLIRPAGSDLAPENHAAIVIHELTILSLYIYIHVFLNLDLIH